MHNIKVTTEELFELVEMLEDKLQYNQDLIPLYKKLASIEIPKPIENFDYEIIDRQLGRMGHLNGTRGHYDRSTLLDKRREFMKWWSKTLIEQGLKI